MWSYSLFLAIVDGLVSKQQKTPPLLTHYCYLIEENCARHRKLFGAG
ncbi:hypothetical protein SynPROS71_01284 [Synechococcus sp. PROS-7-1]|nr:hypothetical protein SynPROS71_01284 [Synechococcus sp. PROS-7-1]